MKQKNIVFEEKNTFRFLRILGEITQACLYFKCVFRSVKSRQHVLKKDI